MDLTATWTNHLSSIGQGLHNAYGWCTVLPPSVQFGHAGAKADNQKETAFAKNEAFKKASECKRTNTPKSRS